ncbi:MAG: chorismate pyruvate-lyase family protein [Clostridia bacterium]|nr:chorismate pyruvate-lyase family protein [Clostridia bacterium]
MIETKTMIVDKTGRNSMIMPLNSFLMQNGSLSLFQKILLATDGTVTDLLRLYTGEAIKVKKLEQEFTSSGEEEVLICSPKTRILRRNILLNGKNKNYVYAASIYIYELLSSGIQAKLAETDMPIGLLWKEEKLDTYREIIGYWTEPCEALAHYFDILPQTLLLCRTYLVSHRKNVIGKITEKFPITFFKD